MTLDLVTLVALGFVGLFAGFVDAIAGGGGLIAIPALLAAGLPPVTAFGTNKVQSVVGTAIAAQTFYLFTIENIKQYGTLKAMGAGNWMLMSMILLQAMLVSITGFGLGMGGATWFGSIANSPGSKLAFYMPLEVFVGTGLAVMAIGILSSLLSMQRVMVVEPAVVFQG